MSELKHCSKEYLYSLSLRQYISEDDEVDQI